LGESKVGDHPVVGIKVARKGHIDVQLFFDKENGLLLKRQYRYHDVRAGKEAEMVITGENFKDFGGLKVPTKIEMKRDGKKYVEAEMSDIKPLRSLDASVFAKP
jgi:hypothetical protein